MKVIMLGRAIRLTALGLCMTFCLSVSQAAPTLFAFNLNVDSVSNAAPAACGATPLQLVSSAVFFCKPGNGSAGPVNIGDQIVGTFGLDVDVGSLANGIYDFVPALFSVEVGMLKWSQNTLGARLPCDGTAWIAQDCLQGYRNSQGAPSDTLGFQVEGGEIKSIVGELFSRDDLPNVTFGYDFVGGPGHWLAHGRGEVGGTMSVVRISEPGVFLLTVSGLLLLSVFGAFRLHPLVESGNTVQFHRSFNSIASRNHCRIRELRVGRDRRLLE